MEQNKSKLNCNIVYIWIMMFMFVLFNNLNKLSSRVFCSPRCCANEYVKCELCTVHSYYIIWLLIKASLKFSLWTGKQPIQQFCKMFIHSKAFTRNILSSRFFFLSLFLQNIWHRQGLQPIGARILLPEWAQQNERENRRRWMAMQTWRNKSHFMISLTWIDEWMNEWNEWLVKQMLAQRMQTKKSVGPLDDNGCRMEFLSTTLQLTVCNLVKYLSCGHGIYALPLQPLVLSVDYVVNMVQCGVCDIFSIHRWSIFYWLNSSIVFLFSWQWTIAFKPKNIPLRQNIHEQNSAHDTTKNI